MRPNISQAIRAGVVAQLCRYHVDMGMDDSDWSLTRLFTYREFADRPAVELEAIIAHCRGSCLAASLLTNGNPSETIPACHLPLVED